MPPPAASTTASYAAALARLPAGALPQPLAMLWLALTAFQAGEVEAPFAATLVFLTVALLEVAAGSGIAWQALQSARVAGKRLRQIVDQAPAVQDPAQPRAYARGQARLAELKARLRSAVFPPATPATAPQPVSSNRTQADFLAAVDRATGWRRGPSAGGGATCSRAASCASCTSSSSSWRPTR